jgi:hypothetical protein
MLVEVAELCIIMKEVSWDMSKDGEQDEQREALTIALNSLNSPEDSKLKELFQKLIAGENVSTEINNKIYGSAYSDDKSSVTTHPPYVFLLIKITRNHNLVAINL